ncbi:Uncharacterized protein OS=Gemmatimonadetes bacterium KBS708 GN=J421_0600 PE=4 SV=1 [Gemmata massiliana]|uniref:Uncharacterized protein n=1 Tax=Gemmata massiliana TaxID=1210884 RepID=A0A6P2D709_9BACT|nr:hypothetical protein [Gemmata massiliana]VTR96245.1 Uncharacterized protein OS=Gemmatimonadetes bacterium KBS708 GN=J421_0600 PE=4 SV=1 [Gemmata massiliana]
MRNLGRRIRGAIGMGLAWGVAWSGAGALVARVPGIDSDLPFPLLFAPFGFVTGIIFSGIFTVFEARSGFDRASLPRLAGWGAGSGLLLAGYIAALRGEMLEVLAFGPALALAGAVRAAGSLVVASRSERATLLSRSAVEGG